MGKPKDKGAADEVMFDHPVPVRGPAAYLASCAAAAAGSCQARVTGIFRPGAPPLCELALGGKRADARM